MHLKLFVELVELSNTLPVLSEKLGLEDTVTRQTLHTDASLWARSQRDWLSARRMVWVLLSLFCFKEDYMTKAVMS